MTSQFTNPVHLYRSLLRETTYLFDSYVRGYVHNYVASSFRDRIGVSAMKSVASVTKHSSHETVGYPSLYDRRQLARGRKFLAVLQRANQGYITQLSKVLRLAYGRAGPKRRRLMMEIMSRPNHPKGAQIGEAVAKKNDGSQLIDETRFGTNWKPPPAFHALLRSQINVQSMVESKRKLRTKPEIPEKNRKGLPMPLCRIRNIQKAWYAMSAQVLCPGLKEVEWEDLKARSECTNFVIPERRVAASIPVFNTHDLESFGTAQRLLKGPDTSITAKRRKMLGNPHKLSSRFLRRMYNQILVNTPRAVLATDGSLLDFHWEGRTGHVPSTKILENHEQVNLLFR